MSGEPSRRLRLTRRHLAVGFVFQVTGREAAWRLGIWGLAWLVWLGSALVSFLHAFS